ncbi:hypothetical protein CWO91_07945 [Bradyrhizobium genosp. SA-3]|nr:hypothetical protein CWO91_07945 [Bradyrhizobium genosp. SA-3]
MAGPSRPKDGVASARLGPGHPRRGKRFEECGCPGPGYQLLRGQALPDMRNLAGKVAEHCGQSRLETLEIRKLLRDRAEVSCGAAAHVLGWLIPTIRVVRPRASRRLSGDDDVLPCRCARPCEAVRDHRGHG